MSSINIIAKTSLESLSNYIESDKMYNIYFITSINNNNNLITAKLNQINSTPKVEQKPVEQKHPTEKGSNLINRFLENQAQILLLSRILLH